MSRFIRINDTFIKRNNILSVSIDSTTSLSQLITRSQQLPQLNIWLNSDKSKEGTEVVTFDFDRVQDRDAIYNIILDIIQHNVEVLF